MSARRGARSVLAVVALTATAIGAMAASTAAQAASDHRAVVVVDLGDGSVRKTVVHFSGDSISGLDALEQAGMDPVIYGFSGVGGAVCALCGKGCAADSSCLTCGGANYWAYFRAAAGSHTYKRSSVGAGSVQIHDGDTEGWRWGNGSTPPPYYSVADLEGPPPTAPPTAPSAAPSATTPASDPPPSAAAATTPTLVVQGTNATAPLSSGATTATTRNARGSAATAIAPSVSVPDVNTTSSSTAASSHASREVAARSHASARKRVQAVNGSSGSAGSLVWFVAVVLMLVGAAVALHLRRRQRNTG